MVYIMFVISGIVIGALLWQLKKGGKVGLKEGVTIGFIGILFGGFIFSKLGITFGELGVGIVLASCSAFVSVFLMQMTVTERK